jgi:hypothetical protein
VVVLVWEQPGQVSKLPPTVEPVAAAPHLTQNLPLN